MDVVGERGQAELGAIASRATHQEGARAHPLLDRPERVLDRVASLVEQPGACRETFCHPLKHGEPVHDVVEGRGCSGQVLVSRRPAYGSLYRAILYSAERGLAASYGARASTTCGFVLFCMGCEQADPLNLPNDPAVSERARRFWVGGS